MGRLAVLVLVAAANTVGQDPFAVDPQHYRVELNNQWVRVLRVHYAPGEGSPMHEHTAGVRVFLTDIHNRFTNADGSTSEASRRAGDVIWAEEVRHANTVLSQSKVEIIELELKQLPPGPARALPKTSPPDVSERVLIENELVRVLWANVPSMGQTGVHAHPNSVVVAMTSEYSRSAGRDGTASENRRAGGTVSWLPEGPHSVKNLSRDALEMVIIELKKRN